MKKTLIMLVVAAALGAIAEDKVWPANYWTVVTNQMTTATPTGNATASQTVSLAGDSASYASSSYAQRLEARIKLMFDSSNAVADFSSFPPGTMFSIR